MPDRPGRKLTNIERLRELFSRLERLPRAKSAEASLKQLCDTLDDVENELSGVEKSIPPPPPEKSDGRMYCPLDDFIFKHDDGSILAMTRGHRIDCSADGGLRVTNRRTGIVEFEK